MKTPKDYLAEMQIDDDILFNRNEVSVWLSDFIKEVQKESYNQAIQDASDNAKIVGGGFYGQFGKVDKNSILKLKIK